LLSMYIREGKKKKEKGETVKIKCRASPFLSSSRRRKKKGEKKKKKGGKRNRVPSVRPSWLVHSPNKKERRKKERKKKIPKSSTVAFFLALLSTIYAFGRGGKKGKRGRRKGRKKRRGFSHPR